MNTGTDPLPKPHHLAAHINTYRHGIRAVPDASKQINCSKTVH